MKFIHLSDLHLGKRVNEFSMLEDQEYILRQIGGIIEAEEPRAVLIAGGTLLMIEKKESEEKQPGLFMRCFPPCLLRLPPYSAR